MRKTIYDLKIGDKVLRRKSVDDVVEWRETTVNNTYYDLIREFPEDYKMY